MGTSLTGTKPKDTYDALIKVGDNGPISGTAKYLSDGLGNDLPIAVSTTNVGIGTSSPAEKLDISGRIRSVTADYSLELLRTSDFFYSRISAEGTDAYTNTNSAAPIIFKTGGSERVRIQAGGGISFNGDTAAANALDDYEEGTWTPAISFGGASTGVAYAFRGGTYTKVGRKVTLNGYIALSNKGSATGNARIEGAPFTLLTGDSALSATTLWYNNVTYTGSYQAFFRSGTTYAELTELTEAGAISALQETDFANNSEIMFSVTYFV